MCADALQPSEWFFVLVLCRVRSSAALQDGPDFTKFNIDNIMGDFEMSPLSEPILDTDKNGNFIDRKGRMVNSRGYLIDAEGNVIDKRGKRMFDKVVLTPEGEIPKIFRMQILKTDSGSSLSRLMDEIEKN